MAVGAGVGWLSASQKIKNLGKAKQFDFNYIEKRKYKDKVCSGAIRVGVANL
jgi:hypothetical protein